MLIFRRNDVDTGERQTTRILEESINSPSSSMLYNTAQTDVGTSIVLRTPVGNNSESLDISTQNNRSRRPRRHWAERDISELARLLDLYHDSPQRWKKILELGSSNNFFAGRSNVDLKDKARQMKEVMLREGKDLGVWKFAVDR